MVCKNTLEKITPEEQREVEDFINFLIVKRKINKQKISTNDIPTEELTKLIGKSGGFDWLDNDSQNIYSLKDGEPVQW
jgi:hypothetical protein